MMLRLTRDLNDCASWPGALGAEIRLASNRNVLLCGVTLACDDEILRCGAVLLLHQRYRTRAHLANSTGNHYHRPAGSDSGEYGTQKLGVAGSNLATLLPSYCVPDKPLGPAVQTPWTGEGVLRQWCYFLCSQVGSSVNITQYTPLTLIWPHRKGCCATRLLCYSGKKIVK